MLVTIVGLRVFIRRFRGQMISLVSKTVLVIGV
jgi:hypothetical protein